MFKKLLLLSFIVISATSYAAYLSQSVVTKKALKAQISDIVDSICDLNDMLFNNPGIDSIDFEDEDFIAFIKEEYKKLEDKQEEISSKMNQQHIAKRFNKVLSLLTKLGFVVTIQEPNNLVDESL